MLFLRRIPRIVATLQLLPLLRQPLTADGPRLLANLSAVAPSSAAQLQTSSLHYSAPAMSSSATEATGAEAATLTTDDECCPAPGTASTSTSTDDTKAEPKKQEEEKAKEEPKLPPLTPAEFQAYNHMAEHMEYFHNHFRSTWNLLWTACTTNKRPASMSLKAFINEGLQFVRHLTMHHNIEEAHIFPVLARKMPEFKSGKGNGAAELLRQHREIHRGMDALEEYLLRCKSGETELEMGVLRGKMESWGGVLWAHLDQEVKTLGAENMRKYWTVAEMRNMPM